MGMTESILSALFVMLVVFTGLVILYVLMRVFTAVVRAIEVNALNRNGDQADQKGGAR
jgi:hypothetical protein